VLKSFRVICNCFSFVSLTSWAGVPPLAAWLKKSCLCWSANKHKSIKWTIITAVIPWLSNCKIVFECSLSHVCTVLCGLLFKLFRRVAAALPGMEPPQQKREDSIFNISVLIFYAVSCLGCKKTLKSWTY